MDTAQPGGDLGHEDVDGQLVVEQGGRLQDDAGGAHDTGYGEEPEEEPVQDHGHVAPVFVNLRTEGQRSLLYSRPRFTESREETDIMLALYASALFEHNFDMLGRLKAWVAVSLSCIYSR